jgi:hypothetical protein
VLSGLEVDDEPEEVVRLADLAVEHDGAMASPAMDREILPSWLSQADPGWSERPGSQVIVPPPPPDLATGAPSPAVAAAAARPVPAASEAKPARRGAPASRSPQAQQHYEHALASAAGGDLQGALRLLRQALALSPRDAEIAQALGQLAFKDRKAPER